MATDIRSFRSNNLSKRPRVKPLTGEFPMKKDVHEDFHSHYIFHNKSYYEQYLFLILDDI